LAQKIRDCYSPRFEILQTFPSWGRGRHRATRPSAGEQDPPAASVAMRPGVRRGRLM